MVVQVANGINRVKSIEKIGLIIRPNGYNLYRFYKKIKEKLLEYDCTLLVDSESAKILNVEGLNFDKLCRQSDLIISLGGDGTLISVSRRSYIYNKPILGINVGKLGFLVDVEVRELESFLDKLFRGEYRIDKRMVLEVIFNRKNSKEKRAIAFNDVVFSRPMVSGMVDLKAYIDGTLFNNYYGDGLIVSTPTGSTAYNLSSGGPVVFPLTEALILTPLCSHSLTQRPLILPANFKVMIKSDDEVLISLDGQEFYNISEYDSIEVKMAKNSVKLIHRLERNYFSVLREKLKWGDA